jgi:16S rRNA (uracil1498-N3)-methyltransferase
MKLPVFYISEYNGQEPLTLDEATSRHIVQVLRMKEGEQLNITDGKGSFLTCEIVDANKRLCTVSVKKISNQKPKDKKITIAISLLKNTHRFEWFLEKATEIGVSEIIPLLCERTEKEKFRFDRMHSILISSMLQSQQCWLPLLHEPTDFETAVKTTSSQMKFIAHCDENPNKNNLSTFQPFSSLTIFIGPEGDFTSKEIELALEQQFVPVSLGKTRLRTETAGVAAAVLMLLS